MILPPVNVSIINKVDVPNVCVADLIRLEEYGTADKFYLGDKRKGLSSLI